jgi:hypothetical protein
MILTPQVSQKAKSWANWGGYKCTRLLPYAYVQHMNVLKHFAMSNMDVGSSLKWLSASTMM